MSRGLDLVPFRLRIDRITDPVVRHARAYFWPVALPLLASGVLLAVFQVQSSREMLGVADAGGGENAFVYFGLFLATALGASLVYLVSYLALAIAAVDAVAGRPVEMGSCWRRAFHLPILGTSILVTVIVFVALLFCFLPAFFVGPLLALVVPVMVEERLYGFSAIARSARLVRFNRTKRWADSGWMQTFVLLLVGMGISWAASAAAQGPFVFWQQYIVIRETAAGAAADPAALAGNLWLQIPAQTAGALISVFVYAFWAFGLAQHFFELRRRKEAPDLEAAIDELVAR